MLRKLGIVKGDAGFKTLQVDLKRLIGRRSNETRFLSFFSKYAEEFSNKLTPKLNQLAAEVASKEEEIKALRVELESERIKNLSTFVSKVFSKNVFGFMDEPSFKILKFLRKGPKDDKSVQKKVRLNHGEFYWRIEYLTEVGLVTPSFTHNKTIFHLSETYQRIFSTKRDLYERNINSHKDIAEVLSLKAVGGDKHGAKKLLSWFKSDRFRRHKDILRKIVKIYPDPSKLSQTFFGMREKGTSHEKHLGIKIKDHRSSGQLLSLGI